MAEIKASCFQPLFSKKVLNDVKRPNSFHFSKKRRLVLFLAGFPALEKQLLKAIKTFPFSLLRCLSGFFSKKACQINLLFAAASKSFSVRSMRNQKFSAREKVLDTSLVSSNYWHAKVPGYSGLSQALFGRKRFIIYLMRKSRRCYFLRCLQC